MSHPAPTDPSSVPTPPADPAPKRSWLARHKVLTTVGAVVLVVIVAGALGGGGGDTAEGVGSAPTADAGADAPAADDAAAPEPAVEEPAAAGIGAPVRDGKFEFTVTAIEPGVVRIGDDMFGKDAQGQFTLVRVTVTNIGDEAQYFDGSSQKLVDAQGRTHSADTSAAVYLGDAESFLNQINPGNSVQGTVVFDLPADATPASLELHDSMFSGGVSVSVG